ncbi:MAG: MATE family efflux transporter [Massiliimalia sp.]|jgi:putative MATE family efflux protein
MQQTFMKTRPILPLVLSMSLPMVVSMMVASLYNIVDSYYVAKISEDAMTALSLVFPVQNLINAITIGFSIGANAVISYHLGAQDHQKANAAATQSIVYNALHGIILTIGCIAIMPFFLQLFTTDEQVIDMGVRYSRIAFAFAVFVAISMSMEKIFQAVGKMMMTMVCMMSGCVANIILDPILIFGWGPFPEMGIEGAALATGIGQILSLAIYIICYLVGRFPVRLCFTANTFNTYLTRKMYSVGIPAALNLALPSLLISYLNIILSAYSQIYVLVLGVYYKLQTFLYLPANGIVQGMRPIIGYNFGAKEYVRVQKIYRVALTLSACIMAVGTILCWLMPSQLIGLFSTNADTIAVGSTALRIISIGFIVSSVSIISCGALEGLGMGTPSLVISLLRYALLIIPVAFILSRLFGAVGVWNAFWITEFVTAIIAYCLYRKKVSIQDSETEK